MAQVFLSYDREDTAKARTIAQALERAGHFVWWDLHIKGGAEYGKVIEQALADADAVVVLWSEHSVDSAWVRDEAAAGRDKGCLIPILLEPVSPPMGFRQYQAIDLSSWSGRPTVARLPDILGAIGGTAGEQREHVRAAPEKLSTPALPDMSRHVRLGLITLLVIAAAAAAIWFAAVRGSGPPTVAVVAADTSPLSRGMARDLQVKLGTLQGNSATNVRLLDASADAEQADLRFAVNGVERSGKVGANVVLVAGREKTMLWSKEFENGTGSRTDLEQSLAFAAARVLGCAVEEASGAYGRLSIDVRRVYLNACATQAEVGWDNRILLPQLRRVTVEAPRFRPAWARLVNAQSLYVSYLGRLGKDSSTARTDLKEYIERARKVDPDMAEATLADMMLHNVSSVGQVIALLDKAKAQEPHNPTVLTARSQAMASIGRMEDALDDAEEAAEVDPLSPYTRTNLITAIAYSGQIERARAELNQARKLWPGAQTIRDAEFAIEFRYGDFERAARLKNLAGPEMQLYFAARRDPNDANVAAFLSWARRHRDESGFVWHGLAEMNRIDEFYAFPEEVGNHDFIDSSGLFRPELGAVRGDTRFMRLANEMGLVEYWSSSGKWPDFCGEPDLPYDCKAEAAKLR